MQHCLQFLKIAWFRFIKGVTRFPIHAFSSGVITSHFPLFTPTVSTICSFYAPSPDFDHSEHYP